MKNRFLLLLPVLLLTVFLVSCAVIPASDGDKTVWLTGTVVPSDGAGEDGNLFLDTSTGLIWLKENGSWKAIGQSMPEKEEKESVFNCWHIADGAPSESDARTGEDGDFYLDALTFDLYRLEKGGWTLIGSLKGDAGEKGESGLPGSDGKDGLPGSDGTDGKDGRDGKDGLPGSDGTDGKDGRDGKDGTDGKDGKDGKDGVDGKDGKNGVNGKDGIDGKDGSLWLFGNTDPVSSQGKNGDLYLNTSSYDVFAKKDGKWTHIGNIKGADGKTVTVPAQEKPTAYDMTVVKIGTDRQVFWDDYIIDESHTTALCVLNSPVRREVVYTTDAAWEGNSCDYYGIVTVKRPNGSSFYRMYYNGWDTNRFSGTGDIVICAIESEDGVTWTRPDYGLISYNGSKHNNIVMKTAEGFDNFFVFADTNPSCPASEKYKAVSEYLGADDYGALHGYVSADGLHWTRIGQLRSTAAGTFDSLNTCFFKDGYYYLYYRGFHAGVRDIRVSKAKTFKGLFSASVTMLTYSDGMDFALYTNNIQPYYRAPQIMVGFPTRYNDHGLVWTDSMNTLPDYNERRMRYSTNPRYATTVTDAMFMTSRDGTSFYRHSGAWATPGAEHTGNWIYGDCYFAYGMIETPADAPGQANDLSMYAFEGKFKNDPSRLYRYTTRIDGFACRKAFDMTAATVTTKPFVLSGSALYLNFATSGAGWIDVEFLDKNGNVLEDYVSCPIFGDQIDKKIPFETAIGALKGKTVRLRFTLHDAAVYSFKFE